MSSEGRARAARDNKNKHLPGFALSLGNSIKGLRPFPTTTKVQTALALSKIRLLNIISSMASFPESYERFPYGTKESVRNPSQNPLQRLFLQIPNSVYPRQPLGDSMQNPYQNPLYALQPSSYPAIQSLPNPSAIQSPIATTGTVQSPTPRVQKTINGKSGQFTGNFNGSNDRQSVSPMQLPSPTLEPDLPPDGENEDGAYEGGYLDDSDQDDDSSENEHCCTCSDHASDKVCYVAGRIARTREVERLQIENGELRADREALLAQLEVMLRSGEKFLRRRALLSANGSAKVRSGKISK
jgi:hypothetical protein